LAGHAANLRAGTESPATVWKENFMAGTIDARLAELGLTLPDAPAPAANYVPYVRSGDLLFISGQISQGPEGLIKGRLGETMDVAEGAEAARRCGLSLLAQARAALGGDLGRVVRVVRLGGFVTSTADFTDQPKVINGCSDLMVAVFGEAGRHARAAVSAPALPLGVAVEIEAVFQVA
jgi:enamine deaminase RidA (YjgF/YER057c/UK114 family)